MKSEQVIGIKKTPFELTAHRVKIEERAFHSRERKVWLFASKTLFDFTSISPPPIHRADEKTPYIHAYP
jgi:hypothetical protein